MTGFLATLASLSAVPTPQGQHKRKKGPDGQKEEEGDPTINQLLLKTTALLLTDQRNTGSRIGTTLLLPADNALTVQLSLAKEEYQKAQPAREVGKAGTAHPWGAPRLCNTAVLFETVLEVYQKDKALTDAAIQIWGESTIRDLIGNLGKLIADAAGNGKTNFGLLEHLVVFFRYRVARSGQGIAEITGGTGRCFHPALRSYNLFGLSLEDMWGILLLPYAEWVTTGPAPKGRMERQVAQLLNKRKN
jgi:hypothetical protein